MNKVQSILSNKILPTSDLQVLSVCFNGLSSQSILNNEILPTFDSQVLFICSNKQNSQPMLSNEILPAFGSQVPSVCSIQQKCTSLRFDILNTNDMENKFINYDISDRNEIKMLNLNIMKSLKLSQA
ncbi:20175_t:CDS:1 [Gigaspora margarita]|uniref:20175_t:CDS:1 n=1 Tax=Gigaspora margarita TaxID=4874 RepID=A0ABN7VPV8_GIGMA|nr:20175_t:CDS:1 [Gigaspora margarita]